MTTMISLYGFNITQIIFYTAIFLMICVQCFIIFVILLQKGENYDTISKLRSLSISTSNSSIRVLTLQLTGYLFGILCLIYTTYSIYL